MIKTSIEKLAEPIGYDIGASDDEKQSSLLNGFGNGLINSIRDTNNLEMQCCHIADKLNPNAIKAIKEIHSFIVHKESKTETE